MPADPKHTDRLRSALLAQIRSAFAHVTREGGVSVTEAYAIDNDANEQARLAARAEDTDTHWSDIHPPTADPAGSALTFMDPIGFRYYLPACMTWALHHDPRINPSSAEDWNGHDAIAHAAATGPTGNENWSALTDPERRCVARFLALCTLCTEHEDFRTTEVTALRAGWLDLLSHNERRMLQDHATELAHD